MSKSSRNSAKAKPVTNDNDISGSLVNQWDHGKKFIPLTREESYLRVKNRKVNQADNVCTQFIQTVQAYIFAYELETTTYMLDRWEKTLFNTTVITVIAGSAYALYYTFS
jgi:hypothetical protein